MMTIDTPSSAPDISSLTTALGELIGKINPLTDIFVIESKRIKIKYILDNRMELLVSGKGESLCIEVEFYDFDRFEIRQMAIRMGERIMFSERKNDNPALTVNLLTEEAVNGLTRLLGEYLKASSDPEYAQELRNAEKFASTVEGFQVRLAKFLE